MRGRLRRSCRRVGLTSSSYRLPTSLNEVAAEPACGLHRDTTTFASASSPARNPSVPNRPHVRQLWTRMSCLVALDGSIVRLTRHHRVCVSVDFPLEVSRSSASDSRKSNFSTFSRCKTPDDGVTRRSPPRKPATDDDIDSCTATLLSRDREAGIARSRGADARRRGRTYPSSSAATRWTTSSTPPP